MPTDRRIFAAVAGVLLLSGCQTYDKTEYMGRDPNWGEANRQTMMAQVVDPEPDYAYDEMETSAEQSTRAIDRYRKDKVKKPERVGTTEQISSGSN